MGNDFEEELAKADQEISALKVDNKKLEDKLQLYEKLPLPCQISEEDLKVTLNQGFSRRDIRIFKQIIAKALSEKKSLAEVSDTFLDYAEKN